MTAGRDVLFVQSNTEIGGAETYLLAALRAWPDLARRSGVLFLGHGRGPLPELVRATGVAVHMGPGVRISRPWQLARLLVDARRAARAQGARILVGNGIHPALFGAICARALGLPAVAILHELRGVRRGAERAIVGLVERTFSGKAVIANSPLTAESWPALSHATVVAPGIDPDAWTFDRALARRELGVADDEVVFASVGRLQRQKGHDAFLRAAALAAAQAPNARFWVVGETTFGLEPEHRDELARLAAAPALRGAARLLGHRDDLPRVLAAADIVVATPSLPESFGLALVEAMASGCAALAYDAWGPGAIVRHDVDGLHVAPGDERALSVAMSRLAGDASLRERLRTAARARARSAFSAEQTGRGLEHAIDAALRRATWPSGEV